MGDSIGAVIERVRRGTRNLDILAICDEVDRLQREVKRLQEASVNVTADKRSYQREYMRNYRKGVLKRVKKRAR